MATTICMGLFSPTLKHLCCAKPVFINPQLLLDQDLSLENFLEDDCICARRQHEDSMVVPYNPEMALLWGAPHSVSKHIFKQYLAMYISKVELSCNIQLPENASLPQKYLRTCVVGAIEAVEVLMGFHQSQMTRQQQASTTGSTLGR